ncbi:putative homeodomain-interacting protein kinase 1-like [Scophthalmus maximus]|uniref:Putative homeodomain-interacting protein kinase 1-like n=1 Tax=Scophthalmus maximus TaxID=52904 RepID=A0A2U9AZF0_SCOMX|nr:putative homeodomain-interacting protein kinase 1-like [Scophthalmus maximus]
MDVSTKSDKEETILYSLPCASFGYVMVKTLGVGGFGAVHKCVALDTKELVALKIVKKEYAQYGKREVRFLERLRKLDPHKNNLVLFNRHLLHNETFMLEFEMLNMTIDDLIMSCARPLHLSEIQVITQQMLVALNALRSRRIVHADIKPDNIMLVNHKLQPLKVKLIDFGMAHTVAELSLGDKIQYLSYRAPEVLLGLHLNEAIDMWALGCVMADMLLGTDLFTPSCEFDRVKDMVQMQGQPDDRLLDSGIYTIFHFCKHNDSPCPSWKLHTACKRCRNRGLVTTVTCKFTSLDDIVKTRPNTTENVDTQAFLSLLKQMMEIDPEKRIIPSKALLHPFISMKDFPSESKSNPDLSSACLTTQRLSRSSIDNVDDSLATHYKSAACPKDEYRLEDSVVEFKPKAAVVGSLKKVFNTSSDDSLSVDEQTKKPAPRTRSYGTNTTGKYNGSSADNENTPPGKASFDDHTPAETQPVLVCHSDDADGGETRTDERSAPFVEIKTRKRHFRRYRLLFSRLFKSLSCSGAGVD